MGVQLSPEELGRYCENHNWFGHHFSKGLEDTYVPACLA